MPGRRETRKSCLIRVLVKFFQYFTQSFLREQVLRISLSLSLSQEHKDVRQGSYDIVVHSFPVEKTLCVCPPERRREGDLDFIQKK